MKKVAFITMDVETFFDTSCVAERNVPYDKNFDAKQGFVDFIALLDRYGVKATLFLTDSVLEPWADEIARCVKNGHKLAVHALIHESPIGYDKMRFCSDVAAMQTKIEQKFGVKAIGYRAPCFGTTDDMLNWLKEIGFVYDSGALNFKGAARSATANLQGFTELSDSVFRDGDFYEIKPPVGKWLFGKIPVGGGAYLRMMPWFLVKSILKRYVAKSASYVFYVHPFELTQNQYPQTAQLPFWDRVFVNGGRKSYIKKIERLLQMLVAAGYEFSSIEDYVLGQNASDVV